jgi:IS110 family transposase
MNYVGIDISKNSFVVAFSYEKNTKTQSYKNTPEGVRKFIKSLDKEQHHCVMEATGNYCFLLLYMLVEQGYRASLINPKQIKYFAKAALSVTKTDPQDALLLALYGKRFEPELYKMPSESIILLKQKRTAIRQLKKQRIASQNLKKSIEVLPYKDKKTIKVLNTTIDFLNNQVKNLEKELFDIASSDFQKQISLLTSIKGIGMTVATSLIIATGGFSFFENPKQISRYIGICPTYQQSGTSVNIKGSINRNGDTSLRSMMFLASITAIRCNSACKEFYTNLKDKGKPSKLALIAVANKLIRQAFAVVKSEIPYQDGFVSLAPNQKQINYNA